VGAVIQSSDLPLPERSEERNVAAGPSHASNVFARNEEGAGGVQQHADANARPAPLGEGVGEPVGDPRLLEDVLNQGDRRPRARDGREHGREELVPILENLDAVSGSNGCAGVRFDGRIERWFAESDARQIVRRGGSGASRHERKTAYEHGETIHAIRLRKRRTAERHLRRKRDHPDGRAGTLGAWRKAGRERSLEADTLYRLIPAASKDHDAIGTLHAVLGSGGE
jgi:hypothetical protein